jgi:recombinational DNA repair protein (RecF pathway)
MTTKTRLSDSKFKDLGFILHQYPYTETSLILDVFTQNHGRINLIAKGAKRPNSQLRPVLQLFQPLWLSYSGKNDLKTLTKAEPEGAILQIQAKYALHILYIHELMMQLCPKQAPQGLIFNAYIDLLKDFHEFSQKQQNHARYQMNLLQSYKNQLPEAIQSNLATSNIGAGKYQYEGFNVQAIENGVAIALRRFELNLLKESGLGLYLDDLAWVLDYPADQRFIYLKNAGITVYKDGPHSHDPSPKINALTLWAILTGDFIQYNQHPSWRLILQESKQLTRYILSTILPYELKTKAVFKSFQG